MIKLTVNLLIFLSVALCDYTLKYFDCAKPEKLTYYYYENCVNGQVVSTKPEEWNLIQVEDQVRTSGWSCQVKRSTFTFMCGLWSYTKIMKIPSVDINVEVSPQMCSSMVNSLTFGLPYIPKPVSIKLGTENIISINELGMIHTEHSTVSCEGQSAKVGNTVIGEVLELDQWRIIILQEEFKYKITDIGSGRIMTRFSHVLLPQSCTISLGGCVADRSYVWDPLVGRQVCQLVEVQKLSLVEVNGGERLVDMTRKLIFQKGKMVQLPQGCPKGEMMETGWEDLRLTKTTGFQKIEADEIKLDLYSDVRDGYLEYNMETKLTQLEGQLHQQLCMTKWIEPGTIQRTFDNKFTTRLGDAVAIFGCEEKIGKILPASSDQCFNKIQIENGLFVDLQTRIATKSASIIPCNSHFPYFIRTEQEVWVTLPLLTRVDAPTEMQTEKEYREDFAKTRGLYTKEELESWEQTTGWGDVHSAVMSKITMGVMNKGNNQQPYYNLDMLEDEVKAELDPWDGWMQTVENWTGILCIIIIIGWVLQLTFALLLMCWTLVKEGLVAAATVLFVLLCSPCHIVHKAQKRKERYNLDRKMEVDQEQIEMLETRETEVGEEPLEKVKRSVITCDCDKWWPGKRSDRTPPSA